MAEQCLVLRVRHLPFVVAQIILYQLQHTKPADHLPVVVVCAPKQQEQQNMQCCREPTAHSFRVAYRCAVKEGSGRAVGCVVYSTLIPRKSLQFSVLSSFSLNDALCCAFLGLHSRVLDTIESF